VLVLRLRLRQVYSDAASGSGVRHDDAARRRRHLRPRDDVLARQARAATNTDADDAGGLSFPATFTHEHFRSKENGGGLGGDHRDVGGAACGQSG